MGLDPGHPVTRVKPTYVSVEPDFHEPRFQVAVRYHQKHGRVRFVQRSRVRGDVLAQVQQICVFDAAIVAGHRGGGGVADGGQRLGNTGDVRVKNTLCERRGRTPGVARGVASQQTKPKTTIGFEREDSNAIIDR